MNLKRVVRRDVSRLKKLKSEQTGEIYEKKNKLAFPFMGNVLCKSTLLSVAGTEFLTTYQIMLFTAISGLCMYLISQRH
jgi:hypothetical protein